MRRHWFIIAVLAFALALRLAGAGREFSPADEDSHMRSAQSYVESGFIVSDRWEHPPLKHILLYIDMQLFGDGPYGRRMRNIAFSVLGVWMVWLIGRRVFPGGRAAELAAVMLASDPLHMFHSRNTFEEPVAAFFMLAAVYLALRYKDGMRWGMALSGLMAGLALATKWYYVIAMAALLIYCIMARRKEGRWAYVNAALSFTLIPMGIYLLSFYAWFGRGYGFAEFVRFQADAYYALQHTDAWRFLPAMMNTSRSAWEWFTRPLIFTLVSKDVGGFGVNVVYMNQPLLWLLVLPAMGYTAYRAVRERAAGMGLVVAVFVLTYALFVPVTRPVFMHSALAVLPYGYLAVGYMLGELMQKNAARWHYALCGAIAAIGLYLMPLTCGMPVPPPLYAPIIAIGRSAMM